VGTIEGVKGCPLGGTTKHQWRGDGPFHSALLRNFGTRLFDCLLPRRSIRVSAHHVSQKLVPALQVDDSLCDRRLAARSITSIAYEAGFGDLSYFNRAGRRHYNATPSDIRNRALRDTQE
jgi:AraC-like DNA-binding protein